MPDVTVTSPRNIPLAKGSRLQEFEILDVVGEGGFGIVYLAADRLLHRTVAVKEYMPGHLATRGERESVVVHSERDQATFQTGMKGFIAEARMLAQFKHPALVEVLRFWEQNGTAYMVMPYYHGKTLRHALRDAGAVVDERWLKTLFAPLLDALEMMHAQHVYHRDFSPDNIMVLEHGAPVLLDLGAARHITGSVSQAVTAVLKPGFAPIEQYADDGSSGQGPWTDIYAIGAVLYFCVTGRPPVASVSRVLNDSLERLDAGAYPRFGVRLLAGIHHALALRQEDRPQTITELRAALDMVVGAASAPAPATAPTDLSGMTPAPAANDVTASVEVGTVAPALPAPARPAHMRRWLVLSGLMLAMLVATLLYRDRHAGAPAPAAAPPVAPIVKDNALPVPGPAAKPRAAPVSPPVATVGNVPASAPAVAGTGVADGARRQPKEAVAAADWQNTVPARPAPRAKVSRCVALLDKISLGVDALTEEDLDYVRTQCR